VGHGPYTSELSSLDGLSRVSQVVEIDCEGALTTVGQERHPGRAAGPAASLGAVDSRPPGTHRWGRSSSIDHRTVLAREPYPLV